MRHRARVLALGLALAACGDASSGLPAETTFTVVPRVSATTIPPPAPPPTGTALPGESLPPRLDGFGIGESSSIFRRTEIELAADLDGIAALGVRWVRLDLEWVYVQADGRDVWRWDRLDTAVRLARERELDVIALLAYTPAWARPAGTTDKHPPTNPDDFARYAREVARRYGPLGVTTFEIWNEPNISTFWAPRPDPVAYAGLLARASAAIRAEIPTATVLTGGMSPAADRSDGRQVRDRTFLRRVYDAGGGAAFEGVALHPYTFPDLPGHATDFNTFLGAEALYRVMVEHGDGAKRIWATEFGAPTSSRRGVDEERQRAILADGYARWRAYPFAGPLLWFTFRDEGSGNDADDDYGLVRIDGTPKPAYMALVAILEAEFARQAAGT